MHCFDVRRSWKRALHRYGVLLMLVILGATLWVGGSNVFAADAPQLAQRPPGTLPPKPTPQPTRVPPTPTPRPRDDGQPSPPAPTPTVVAGAPALPGSGDAAVTVVLTGTINAPTLNVRQGPATTFPILGRLTSGVTVTVVARTADNAWLKVCCLPAAATSGWVSAQFVTPAYTTAQRDALPVGDGTPSSGQPISPSTTVTGSVTVVALNVRADASTSAGVLGKLTNGEVVTLLGRNAAADWWLICCVAGGGNGWVAAQFIAPAAGTAALTALPVTSGLDTPAATPPLAAASTVTPTAAGGAAVGTAANTTLRVTAAPQPAAAVQGESLLVAFTLTNTGAVAAAGAELSFEVPAGLKLVSVSATDGGEAVQEDTASGAPLVIVTWPTLSAGAGATVKITMVAGPDLANGTVLDGAAEVLAGNAAATFVPVSVGMPPAEPPDFQ